MLLITLFQLLTLLEACMFIIPQRKTVNSVGSFLYSAFPDKIKRNYRFPTPGWNWTTHRQALQGFPDTCQV
jgi:hypothetical protein